MPSQKVPGRPGGNISRFERPGDPSQRNTQVRHMAPPRAAYDREEKRVFPYWTIPVVLVCVGLLSLLSWLAAREYEVYRQFQNVSRQVATGTLYPGISVNGVDVGGMTLEEATAALETNTQQQGEAFAIGIAYGERKWRITSEEVPLRFDTQEVLERAFALGRRGSLRDRYAEIQSLQNGGVSFATSLGYDREKVRELTDTVAAAIDQPATDATLYAFDPTLKSFVFTPEQAGFAVDADKLYADVLAALDAGQYDAMIQVTGAPVQPAVTQEMLVPMFGRISSFTTETTNDSNRNTNISLSADALNGKVVMPGETLSFNESTGQRTAEKGYKEAGAISGGQLIDDTGGGVCQTSSTLFNAVVRADLEIVERSQHTWPSSYVPRGEDAAVDWPRLDFVFRNNTDYPIFLLAWYADQTVTVEVYGKLLDGGGTIDLYSETIETLTPSDEVIRTRDTSMAPGTSKVAKQKRTGYVVDTYKVYYDANGVELRREKLWRTTYRAVQKEIYYN